MRSDTLLFFHVLAAMLLLGTTFTVAILLLALPKRLAEPGRVGVLVRLAYRLNLMATLPLAALSLGLGEGLRAQEDAEGHWLDVSSGLTYVAVMVGALLLHGFLRRALAAVEAGGVPSASTIRGAASIAPAIVAAILVIAFLMSAKPA